MSEIILTVDTPVLKGEKGDKGETGVFDYGELDRVVKNNLDSKFSDLSNELSKKTEKPEGKDFVDNKIIKTFSGLEQWNDNKLISENEAGEQIEEDRTIVKVLNTKMDNQDFDTKLEEAKGEFQNYIDEKLVTAGSGDMLKSVYDKNGDGVIDLAKQADNASTVNGKTVETSVPENALFSDTTYDEASPDKAGLMSSGDKVKLNGIASGATRVEVVDALGSTEIGKALSANQGKVLNDNINNGINDINGSIENIDTRLNKVENDAEWVDIDPSRIHITKGTNCGGLILKQAQYRSGFVSLYVTCWASKTLTVGSNLGATITFDDYEIVSTNVPAASYAGTTVLITSFTNKGIMNSRILANQYAGTNQDGSYGIHFLVHVRKK